MNKLSYFLIFLFTMFLAKPAQAEEFIKCDNWHLEYARYRALGSFIYPALSEYNGRGSSFILVKDIYRANYKNDKQASNRIIKYCAATKLLIALEKSNVCTWGSQNDKVSFDIIKEEIKENFSLPFAFLEQFISPDESSKGFILSLQILQSLPQYF